MALLCVGIMRCRIAYKQVAECSAVIDGNADADGIAVWVNHRCQMAGGVLPVRHSLFGNPFGSCSGEHRQIGTEAMGIPRCRHSLTFRPVIMLSVQAGRTIGAEHIRFHDLRHTFATLSLKNGVDVKTLSSTLGHYSAGFTLSTYTHATPEMMREAADTMGDVIGKAI